MRKNILLIIIILYTSNCFAQETVKKRDRLTASVIEEFHVLKTDKQTKQGLYRAIYNHKIVLAQGEYANDKRVGMWHFYDTRGTLMENFNYDIKTLLYEEPIDSLSQTKIIYAFDTTFTNTDRVTKPIKIGGRCFGYIPYLKIFQLSSDFDDVDLTAYTAILEILVSPGGRLADYKVHIKSPDFEWVTTFSTELIGDDDKLFLPATINSEPILSRIFVKCRITDDGSLDVD